MLSKTGAPQRVKSLQSASPGVSHEQGHFHREVAAAG